MQTLQRFFAVIGGVLLAMSAAFAQSNVDHEHAEVADAIGAATETLQAGLSAAAKYGQPISAKFEIGFEELQLSVYVVKEGAFSEVLVERNTGKTSTPAPLTDPDDLARAKAQSAAMAKATRSLSETVGSAIAAHPGFRAASVVPTLTGGHPVAEVALVNRGDWKTVTVKLD